MPRKNKPAHTEFESEPLDFPEEAYLSPSAAIPGWPGYRTRRGKSGLGYVETQAEFAQAIELYEEVLKDHPKETKVREQFFKLRKAWALGNKTTHPAARKYIYETWPKLADPGDLKKGLGEVRDAFLICKQFGDALTPQKILLANVNHADHLKKRLASLRPQASEDDRKEAETIAAVAEGLKKLHVEVAEYLKKPKKKVTS